MMEGWVPSTQKSYNTYIAKYHVFCLTRGIDRRNPKESHICAFLHSMYKEGYSYGAVNTARCALSILLPRAPDGTTVGCQRWVSRTVKTVHRKRPPQPKHSKFWDVGKVFD